MTPSPLRRMLVLVVLGAMACRGAPPAKVPPEAPAAPDPDAVAELVDAEGRQIGVATFGRVGQGATIGISVSRLSPGRHGIHVHQRGTCAPPAFESAEG